MLLSDWIATSLDIRILAAWDVAWSNGNRILAVSLGVVCAVIAIALSILSRSRWGQNKPLTKCIILAVLAHVWLLMYAYGTRYMLPGQAGPGYASTQSDGILDWVSQYVDPDESSSLSDNDALLVAPETLAPTSTSEQSDDSEDRSQDQQPDPMMSAVQVPELLPTPVGPALDSGDQPAVAAKGEAEKVSTEDVDKQRSPSLDRNATLNANEMAEMMPDAPPEVAVDNDKQLSDTPQAEDPLEPGIDQAIVENPSSDQLLRPAQTSVDTSKTLLDKQLSAPSGHRDIATRAGSDNQVPEAYQLRTSSSRLAVAMQYGGDESTEAAVEAALGWLARNQEADGSWNAMKHGAGRETKTLQRDRAGTGSKADTGMTGLSTLAFLAAGYTHREGKYEQPVHAAIQFLVRSQMPSGDLAGLKQVGNGSDVYFARMYCHGMATLALAEAFAMTKDPGLAEPIQRAVAFTLRAQNPRTGGWRYQSFANDDPGDTSQFGWQSMAILSSVYGGFQIERSVFQKMDGYLDRVAAGRYGGQALYRPVAGQEPTPAMTAEALALRLMLKKPTSDTAIEEAKAVLLKNLPGGEEENLYLWYYASIALCQFQDADWTRWNDRLKATLIANQTITGPETGCWPPRCIWSGYGGKVYSTALSCLCLEVYYRYLPMYQSLDRHDEGLRSPSVADRAPDDLRSPGSSSLRR